MLRLVLLVLLLLAALLTSHVASAGPVRVFVLAGQSNMVGHGSTKHLHQLVTNKTTSSEYAHLWSGSNWIRRKDVFAKFEKQFGNLTVGYGYNGNFGPELEFGWGLSQALNGDKVLLIKTAWGGKSLAIEFRPPSSGVGNYSYCKTQTQKCYRYQSLDYGTLYRLMVSEVQQALTNIDLYVPGYNKSQGYVLSGFIWLQGESDIIGGWSMVGEYQRNLINLIKDIRKDLKAPTLPVIIGEVGEGGVDPPSPDKSKILAIRQIEQEVALKVGHARFVTTSIHVNNNASRYDTILHYWGRADTVCHIGSAFRKVMIEMIHGAKKR